MQFGITSRLLLADPKGRAVKASLKKKNRVEKCIRNGVDWFFMFSVIINEIVVAVLCCL